MGNEDFATRFALDYREDEHRRHIAGAEVIIHCHHYNSRLQNVIEGASSVDGKAIITSAAEAVMREQLAVVLRGVEDDATRWQLASGLYAQLGFGVLDFGQVGQDLVSASSSHFVEGWSAGFSRVDRPVCSFTEGYVQAAVAAVSGDVVTATETRCLMQGADRCEFRIDRSRQTPMATNDKVVVDFTPQAIDRPNTTSNIDEDAIVSAVVGMPIYGNEEGLIPAFGVYLANTPADFYNQICIRFIEAMNAVGHGRSATRLLLFAGETCAMNTFRGIMHSPEWDALIAPMIKEQADELFALVALSNGFGWGNWFIADHEPRESLLMRSLNGYEALGYRQYRGQCASGQCLMLTGVSAGMMELIYGEGAIEERFGTYYSEEDECIASGEHRCDFQVEAV